VKPDKPHGWKKALVIAVVLLAVTPFVFFLIYIAVLGSVFNLGEGGGPIFQDGPVACQADFQSVAVAAAGFKRDIGVYPGGQLQGVQLHPLSDRTMGNGIATLRGTATRRNRTTVGPWLSFSPGGIGTSYVIRISDDGKGVISVTTSSGKTGKTHTIADCMGS
jgi:hypothetical protein